MAESWKRWSFASRSLIRSFFNTTLTVAEDVDWYARANDDQIPYHMIPQVLLYKRVHDSNSSLNEGQNLLQALRASIQRKQNLGA